ncbi:RNA polymerase sigma factor [Psychromicrobium lacuslunae]|uniref:RNA polymerase subunit sigma-24 n=1 Tax=Psychromicrobium lacuslunae TaxID=1618207 RepID=A0A0D4BY97_9MICC|nr:DUF6596 domain-containing protein [Psychromicrobium lacuslunae]AJT41090.1 RNA polymerase subunit sigma-24 [Psychromicrobium lacuslunae]
MSSFEDVWRSEAPHVLHALLNRYQDFEGCEDALQEALLEASQQWPIVGIPEYPRGWLITTASRRYLDLLRRDNARQAREVLAAATELESTPSATDDTLQLFFLCVHPALSPSSQVALILRALGGLTTAQIAAAFLVPERTMGQRISRAKATLRERGVSFQSAADSASLAGVGGPGAERLSLVRHSLYLVFNEGYTSSTGESLLNISLADEAMRLCRELLRQLPEDAETAGLLALMLLLNSRRVARLDQRGDLIPLAEQDRSQWDRHQILEAVELLERTLPGGHVGRFQLEAAISAVHAEAPSAEETDWPQIVLLYEMLDRIAPSPLASLGHAVALAMVHGPEAGLAQIADLSFTADLGTHHRTFAVRGHLLEMAGSYAEALQAYQEAARLTRSLAEQRYLNTRATEVAAKVKL